MLEVGRAETLARVEDLDADDMTVLVEID